MLKINLNRAMRNGRGEVMKLDKPNPAYENLSDEQKKKTDIPKVINRVQTMRDYLLIALSLKFSILDTKENFWTSALGQIFSDEEKDIVEISDGKAAFLRRLFEKNKFKQQNPMGQETEIEIFFPFEVGQILPVFMSETEKRDNEIEDFDAGLEESKKDISNQPPNNKAIKK